MNAELFPPQTIFLIANSDDPAIQPFIGKIFQVLFAEEAGLLANPAIGCGLDAVYVSFGSTDFTLNPAGNFSFAPLSALSTVFDTAAAPGNQIVSLSSFCPDQEFLERILAASFGACACAPTPLPTAASAPVPVPLAYNDGIPLVQTHQ